VAEHCGQVFFEMLGGFTVWLVVTFGKINLRAKGQTPGVSHNMQLGCIFRARTEKKSGQLDPEFVMQDYPMRQAPIELEKLVKPDVDVRKRLA
jgi:hypothetical protein